MNRLLGRKKAQKAHYLKPEIEGNFFVNFVPFRG
jgi:hypothetical protein